MNYGIDILNSHFFKLRINMFNEFSNQFSNQVEIDKITHIPQWFNNFHQFEVIEYYYKDTS